MWRGALYDVGESVELELHVYEGRGERGGRERACSAIGGASARVERGRRPRRLGVDHGAAEAVAAARRACAGKEGVAEHDGDDLQEGEVRVSSRSCWRTSSLPGEPARNRLDRERRCYRTRGKEDAPQS